MSFIMRLFVLGSWSRRVLMAVDRRRLAILGQRVFREQGLKLAERTRLRSAQLGNRRLNRRSGTYARSFRTDPGRNVIRVTNTAPYAASLEVGARPHEITGNPYLSFVVGNTAIIVPKVDHPGNRAYNILADGLAQALKEVF